MSLILIVQPDPSQALVLHDVGRRIGAELEIVDSSARAVEAIARQVPDLILLSALLSPRDEDTLMARLRTLEGASHLQTLAIPQFRAAAEEKKGKKSSFGFGRKPKAAVSVGCDPAAFGEEVVTQLARANEIRTRPVPPQPIRTVIAPDEPVEPVAETPGVEPAIEMATPAEEDEIDKLVRQLGLDVKMVEIEEVGPQAPMAAEADEEAFDFTAALDRARVEAEERRTAELAQLQIDAEAIREAAIAEARATAELEAREALAVDLARLQAEAEAMREVAMAEARAAAEHEARQTLHAELARVRSETEVTVADALNKVKVEAEESERARAEAERLRVEAQSAFAAELARVRAEVEQKLTVQLEAARAEAERMRTAEAAAGRERVAAEAQLKSELDRLRFVAAQVRKADESETKKAADQIKHLEGELVQMRTKAEQRQIAELDDIKNQMAEMREAAARHVRAAAAEAVAAEVARATAHAAVSSPAPRPTAVITQFPLREVARIEEPQQEIAEIAERPSRDYLSLWQQTPEPVAEAETASEEPEDRVPFIPDLRPYAKWALPVAACLLLVTTTGTAISTVARFVRPAEKPPALTVEPVVIEPFIEVVEKRVGRLQVESTPSGAEAVIDGRSYGQTPVTIPNLEIGNHTLVLKSGVGSITRKVTIKANQTTLLSEAIFSGWLAIFSPIPVTAVIDGVPVNLTDDGRFMTTPGQHIVELISERFNYRATETIDVRPGETTAHTVSLPTGSVRVTAPEGAEIRIDGQPPTGVPAEGLPVAIGTHAITATHADLGERRIEVDVRHGSLTEVTLVFE